MAVIFCVPVSALVHVSVYPRFGLTVLFHLDCLFGLLYRHNLAKEDYKIDMIKSNNGIIMK